MKPDELKKRILRLALELSGATVEELVDELAKVGYKKYDTFKAIESLASKKLVELVEIPEKFDPYRPAWTKSVYITDYGKKLVEEEKKTYEKKCSVILVLTHPIPTATDVKYISFLEALELLFSEEDEVVGIVGFIDVRPLVELFGCILQKHRKPFSIKLLCTKIIPENDELTKKKAVETLEAMGIQLKLAEAKDEYSRNLHAKFLTSGDLSYVGSHNLLKPALSRNLEVGLLVRDEGLAKELKKTFWELWRSFHVYRCNDI